MSAGVHYRPQYMLHSGLDALAEGSEYALQQMQQQQQQQEQDQRRPQPQRTHSAATTRDDHRDLGDHAAANGTLRSSSRSLSVGAPDFPSSNEPRSASQPVRRRISRACDQCNQLRTKCDGKSPCAHCVEFNLTCEYARERKKRGKASKKDLAAQEAAAAAAAQTADVHQVGQTRSQDVHPDAVRPDESDQPPGLKRKRSSNAFAAPHLPASRPSALSNQHPQMIGSQPAADLGQSAPSYSNNYPPQVSDVASRHDKGMPLDPTGAMSLPPPQASHLSMPRNEYEGLDDYHRNVMQPANAALAGHHAFHGGQHPIPNSLLQGGSITGYADNPYAMPSPGGQTGVTAGPFKIGGSPASAEFLGQSPPVGGSPSAWLTLPSPSAMLFSGVSVAAANQALRYPVLRPLLPHIGSIMPVGLACDLLELYFASTSSTFMNPQSPYVLGYIFRKRSFLRTSNPRPCSPALLSSMLWVAAQTSESAFLTSPPSARAKTCQKLLELTVGLLRPLIHNPGDGMQAHAAVINGVALGGLGVALHAVGHEMGESSPGASGALDDVAAYIHLATVVSASEYKAASLRWWNAAWTLARELKLGRELPLNTKASENGNLAEGSGEHGNGSSGHEATFSVSEEEREERRRIWWLLYIVDRHLALCYNRPLFLLDVECDGLYQPENESTWQANEFYYNEGRAESDYLRPRGPPFECSGHSIFGFFLPLMTILGEIVDLNHARNHPRFGARFRGSDEWNDYAQEITHHLERYGRSLEAFEARHIDPTAYASGGDGAASSTTPLQQPDSTSPSALSVGTNHSAGAARVSESVLQTRMVAAYGTHLMHTLHILLNGKWDPLALLDDTDLWISSPGFISATGHAVAAADAVAHILDRDPDLSAMPFFFGIYLLQGSFLLLLIADKLQADASPAVVRACESIVRAHEACVVTLNTEYQRNFRKVMRSALAQVRGRVMEDPDEQRLRRREVLALYRWTGDGTGLAL